MRGVAGAVAVLGSRAGACSGGGGRGRRKRRSPAGGGGPPLQHADQPEHLLGPAMREDDVRDCHGARGNSEARPFLGFAWGLARCETRHVDSPTTRPERALAGVDSTNMQTVKTAFAVFA